MVSIHWTVICTKLYIFMLHSGCCPPLKTMELLYKAINVFFFLFHVGLIIFNLFGWLVPGFRKWNLITLGLTAFSWVVLGAFFGFGYCFLTDWHWAVREKLGYTTSSNSYIHFLIAETLPVSISEETADTLTVVLFVAASIASIAVNVFAKRKQRRQ